MLIVSKLASVVTYWKKLPALKSHDPYAVCRFRMQLPKSYRALVNFRKACSFTDQ